MTEIMGRSVGHSSSGCVNRKLRWASDRGRKDAAIRDVEPAKLVMTTVLIDHSAAWVTAHRQAAHRVNRGQQRIEWTIMMRK